MQNGGTPSDAISRELTVANGAGFVSDPNSYPDAASRELTVANGPGTSGSAGDYPDAVSRELTVANGPDFVGDPNNSPDAVSRELTVNNAPPVDTTPPTTSIVSGPAAVVCTNTVTFTFTGTDNITAVPNLEYIYRLDGGTWSAPQTATTAILGLLGDGTHTFEVAAVDQAGNVDPKPAASTFTVNTALPVISGVTAAPTVTGATVTWTTDKLATSEVDYRVQGMTLWTKSGLDLTFVAAHTITLAGLTPATIYEYQVYSADACGQQSVSGIKTFTTTKDTPPTTTILSGPDGGATVCDSTVTFTFTGSDAVTPTNKLRYEYRLDGGLWSGPTSATTVTLTGLNDGPHTFEVAAVNEFGTADPNPVKHTFTVNAQPPVISAVAATPTDTSAVVTWNTDKLATSQVDYRVQGTTDWTSTTPDLSLVTAHSVALSSLQIGVSYEFRIHSSDACDHAVVSLVQTLTTQNPVPTITSLSPTSAFVGTTGLTLAVNGSGFLPTSTVTFGPATGLVPVTGSVTPTHLQVVIPDSALTNAGPVSVTVTNPAPGGGASNAAAFTVAAPAPPAPVLQALAAGDTQVSLIFTTVPNATSYTLKSSAQSGGPYTTDVTGVTATTGTASVTAVDPNQTNGTLRYYVVSAVGPGGESPNSNELSTTPRHINLPPTVTLTSPADGTTLTAPGALTLSATASDPDGTVAQVEFFQNDVSIGVVSAAPYTLPVPGVPAGINTFVAVATDNSGATAVSNVVTVIVTTPTPGAAILTGPADQALICTDTVVFTWTGYSDTTPAAQLRYQYQVDGRPWSDPTTATQQTLTGLAEGLHTFTLRLLNADGSIAGSPVSVSFTVSLTPPTLLSNTVDARDTRAVINWTTSKPTTGQIEYGTTTAYGQNAPADTVSDGAHHTSLTSLATQTTYHYRIHFTDGCHDIVSDDQTFTTQPLLTPNLELTAATVPPSFAPLDTINLSWSVLNAGLGDALVNWTDSVYLSTKNTLDVTATVVGSFNATSTLYSFSSYTQNQTVTIPRVPAGSYYIIIQTNSSNVLPETTTSDNTLATPVQITALQDLVVTPDQPAVTLKTGAAVTGQFTLTDLSLNALTGITANVQGAPANITVQLTPPTSLQSLQSQSVTYTVTAADASVLTGAPTVVFTSDSGAKATATLNITVVPPTPQLVVAPLTLKTSMLRGGQRLVDFTVTNTGDATATALTLVLPGAPWLSLTTSAASGDLAPGATATFELALTPAPDLPLGLYSGTIGIKGRNAGISIPFAFNCISANTGGLKVVAQDEYSFFADTHPNVAGAHVVISDYTTGVVAVDDVTDANGLLMRTSVPEGDYNVDATADGHAPFHGKLHLIAGETNEIDPFLSRQLVTYAWDVVPIPFTDQYTVSLNATFVTNVPAPVVTVSPVLLDLTKLSYDASGNAVVNYTITNHGLIAANDTTFNFESDSLYTLTPAISSLGTLPPLSSVIVPMIITRHSKPAQRIIKSTRAHSAVSHVSSSGAGSDPSALNGSAAYTYQCGGTKSGSGTAKALTGEGGSPTNVGDNSSSTNSPPSVGSNGNCQSTVMIRTDANRDGTVTFDGQDDTTADKPYTFWINDDSDMMASGEFEGADPAVYGKDYLSDDDPNARDVEDFERLQIKLPTDFDPSGNWEVKLQFTPTSGDPQIKVVPAPDTSLSYLTGNTPVKAFYPSLSPILRDERTIPLSSPNLKITNGILPLLFEGVHEGSGALMVHLYKSGSMVAEDHVDLDIKPITKMYDHYTADPDEHGNPQGDSGDSNNVSIAQILTGSPNPVNMDQTTHTTNDYILFVHGWRMQRWERIAYAQTAFKRLWHLGYKGQFGLFSWPTEYIPGLWAPTDVLPGPPYFHLNYDESEQKAFNSAQALNSLLSHLSQKYHVNVFAHSMGNHVVSEALRLEVERGVARNLVQTYVATQSAVPAQAYDANAPSNALTELKHPFIPNIYSHYPAYTDPPYFGGINLAANKIVNFYNPSDFALKLQSVNELFKPDSGDIIDFTPSYIYDPSYDPFNLQNGFAKEYPPLYLFQNPLDIEQDRYEIFSRAAPAFSYALGAQVDVGGPFTTAEQINLNTAPYSFGGGTTTSHSAEFESTFSIRFPYWKALLNAFGMGNGVPN